MASEKRREYLAVWRAKNREKIKLSQAKYYAANKAKCSAACVASARKKPKLYSEAAARWRENNPERNLEVKRAFYQRHRAAEILKVRKRQGSIRQGLVNMSRAEAAEVQALYDFCRYFPEYEVDHTIPLNGETVSGLHVLGNLQVLTRRENRSKGAKFSPDALPRPAEAIIFSYG